jgi:hypothetical protein
MILTTRQFATQFQPLQHTIISPGFLQSVTLSPLPDERSPYSTACTVTNIYLPSGATRAVCAERKTHLTRLINHFHAPAPQNHLIGGDFNMTEHPGDSSGGDHFASSHPTRKLLSKTINHLKASEVYQPSHTCIHASTTTPTSSRIDRFYVTQTPASNVLMSPEVSPPPPPIPSRGYVRC